MPSISLTLPIAGNLITAALHSGNYTALQNLLNAGLDGANLKGGPALATGEVPVWDGTNFARSSVTKIASGSFAGIKNVDVDPTAAIVQSKIAFDAWQTYTPTWTASTTNPTLGNGTITGRWVQIGKTVHAILGLTLGSTSTVGSGTYSFSLPVTASVNASGFIGAGRFIDSSAGAGYPSMVLLATNTTVQLHPLDIAPTSSAYAGAFPVVPAVGDTYTLNFTYEAA